MKIIEIIPQLSSGGGERFTVDLCNELANKGHDVLLIVLFPIDNSEYSFYLSELSEKVQVKSMNKKKGIDIYLPFKLRKIIKDWKPDIVHTHLRAIIYTALTSITCRGIKYIHTVHNTADKEAGGIIGSNLRKLLFKRKYIIPITISDESHESFLNFYNIEAPMIFNGRNIPIDLTACQSIQTEIGSYKKNAETRVFVNIARFTDVKRQDMIARICKRLYDEGYNFAMLLIGRAECNDVLEKVNALSCPVVYILGEKHNPLEYLAIADGFCLLSRYEGMPISLIEAMGCGAVPICTPVGGIVDVIKDGVNGFLAESINEEDCYMAMKRFLETPDDEIELMKLATKEAYIPYSMSKCADNYLKLMEQ